VANKLPTDTNAIFILCESVRPEERGKITLIGAFIDGIILVPPSTTTVTLTSLGLLFAFKDGEGTFSTEVSIFSPSNNPILNKAKLADSVKKSGFGLNVVVNIAPFHTNEFGPFRVSIYLDNQKYERTFEIRKDASIA
jgi:hypothetical protein